MPTSSPSKRQSRSKAGPSGLPTLPVGVEPLHIWDPRDATFVGIPVKPGSHLDEQLRSRAEKEYGAIVPSPLGRSDRLFNSRSAALLQKRKELYLEFKEAEPDQPWEIIGQGAFRENPGQGSHARPDPGIKLHADALDEELAIAFWRKLGKTIVVPDVMSVPREKGMGIPWFSREEAFRATTFNSLEEFVLPLLEGIVADTIASFRDGALATVKGVVSPANLADWRGSRQQPAKVGFEKGEFVPLSTKQYWLWNSAKEPVNVRRQITVDDVVREVCARVRRVLGKNVIPNTLLSAIRRIATCQLYIVFEMLPSQEAEQRRAKRSAELDHPGTQFDGDGTDTKCPPWLFPLYGRHAARADLPEASAMCLLSHLFNFSAAAQPSNAWRSAGISSYGTVDKLYNDVYMGFRSGIDTVAFQAFISQAHGLGRVCADPIARKFAAGKGVSLPGPSEFWDWYAENCKREMPAPGLPAKDVRGDGFLMHTVASEAEELWEPMLTTAGSQGGITTGSHLHFQKDPTASSDGKRWVKGALRWDAPRRLAYFGNADDLRTDRDFLGISLVALVQALSEWPNPRVVDGFVEMVDIATDGAIPDVIQFATELAGVDVDQLGAFNYNTMLTIASPDKAAYMPEAFLQLVDESILAQHRTYLTPARSAEVFSFAREWSVKLTGVAESIYQRGCHV